MFKTNFIIFFFTLNTLFVFPKKHTKTEYFECEGYNRSYQFFVPNTYSPDVKCPLVFVLHGGGGTALGLIRSTKAQFNQLAERDNFIVVYPNGIEKS